MSLFSSWGSNHPIPALSTISVIQLSDGSMLLDTGRPVPEFRQSTRQFPIRFVVARTVSEARFHEQSSAHQPSGSTYAITTNDSRGRRMLEGVRLEANEVLFADKWSEGIHANETMAALVHSGFDYMADMNVVGDPE